MRVLLLVVAMILAPTGAHAAPVGKWVCRYKSPDQKQEVRLSFAHGKLVVDRGIGGVPATNAVITDDLVTWRDGVGFEFFPKERRMTRTSASGKDDLVCIGA